MRQFSKNKEEFRVGDYIVKQTLGKGTFGEVRLGYHIETKQKVAVKILEKRKIVEKDDEIRVKRELKMLTSLNHPNVIQVFEIMENKDRFFIVMEYCDGGEVFSYIVDNLRLSEEEAAFFYFQLIRGLEYIHSKNIAHRDLKPENLLLTSSHKLKIIDFGLSNYFTGDLLATPCGSPCYASPEMVNGFKYNGFRTDVWATGVILYAMVCGFLPFEDKDNEILFKKILQCKLDFPDFVGKDSKDLMQKILVKTPDTRITIDGIKEHPFYIKGNNAFRMKFGKVKENDFYINADNYLKTEGTIEKKEEEETKNNKALKTESNVPKNTNRIRTNILKDSHTLEVKDKDKKIKKNLNSSTKDKSTDQKLNERKIQKESETIKPKEEKKIASGRYNSIVTTARQQSSNHNKKSNLTSINFTKIKLLQDNINSMRVPFTKNIQKKPREIKTKLTIKNYFNINVGNCILLTENDGNHNQRINSKSQFKNKSIKNERRKTELRFFDTGNIQFNCHNNFDHTRLKTETAIMDAKKKKSVNLFNLNKRHSIDNRQSIKTEPMTMRQGSTNQKINPKPAGFHKNLRLDNICSTKRDFLFFPSNDITVRNPIKKEHLATESLGINKGHSKGTTQYSFLVNNIFKDIKTKRINTKHSERINTQISQKNKEQKKI
ncbi:MAG: serine/threonine-protein kinase [archaeon]|nr:serine/threonine-protein kinase [archaeon]